MNNTMKTRNLFVKSALAVCLAAVMVLSMTACGNRASANSSYGNQPEHQVTANVADDSTDTENAQDTSSDEDGDDTTTQNTDSITMIGDSVMLGAAPALQELFPNAVIDAKESRQVVQAGSVVDNLASQGELGDIVVIALGTNGTFNSSSGQELIDKIGSDKTIYWVTAYGEHLDWQDDSNAAIEKVADNNDNVTIIDWAAEAPDHPEWFYDDGIHLKSEGQEGYAKLIQDSIS